MPFSSSRPIERRPATDVRAFLASDRLQRPAVLTGALEQWPGTLFDLGGLAARFAATAVLTYRVAAGQRMSAVDSGFYAWTDEEGPREHLRSWTFGELVAGLQRGEAHYCMANKSKNVALRDQLAAEAGDVECARVLDEFPGRGAREFFVGSEGAGPGLHHDGPVESFLCQLVGTKRVNVFSPADLPYLYPAAAWPEPHSHFSLVADTFRVDRGAFPLFERATLHACELRPGDVLYVPPHWYHDPCPTGPNASMTVRCTPPP